MGNGISSARRERLTTEQRPQIRARLEARGLRDGALAVGTAVGPLWLITSLPSGKALLGEDSAHRLELFLASTVDGKR